MPRSLRSLVGLVGLLATLLMLAPSALARSAPAAPASASEAPLQLVLPLAANTPGLERFATEVSTPGSPFYHQYRSIAWLSAHFGASLAAQRKVSGYLRARGATDVRIDATGLFVDAELTPARAQALFGTRLSAHRSGTGDYLTAAAPARVPAALHGLVTGVVGLDTGSVLAAPSLATARPDEETLPTAPNANGSGYAPANGTPTGCAAGTALKAFTPNEYLTAYNDTALQNAGFQGQGERVALIEVDGFNAGDVRTFARCFGLTVPKIVAFRTNATVSRAGLAPGGEATLDLEVLDSVAPKLSQIDVYESSEGIASVLKSLTAPLQNSGYKPEVISVSLGLCEPQVLQAVGRAGIKDTEAALAEAAASGISVLAASGDDGSADCVNADSPQGLPLPELAVNYPSSSPWVTGVGGTNLVLNAANQISSQVVWNDGSEAPGSAGGGGQSILFSRPSWQAGVVPVNQRTVPDVSGLADVTPGYAIYCTATPDCVPDGSTSPWQAVGGTSASTPLLAGGLALVDQELREHKQQDLGLINPLLYAVGANASAAAQVFSDVSVGSDDVGPFIQSDGAALGCCDSGPGYDAASGWGSVNLGGLAAEALASEPAIVNVAELVPRGQAPVAHRVLEDRVSCSGACEIGAFAKLIVPGANPVTLYSGLAHLRAAGSKLIRIPISSAELARLRTALTQHRRVSADIVGAIVDAAGNVERQTPSSALTITG